MNRINLNNDDNLRRSQSVTITSNQKYGMTKKINNNNKDNNASITTIVTMWRDIEVNERKNQIERSVHGMFFVSSFDLNCTPSIERSSFLNSFVIG